MRLPPKKDVALALLERSTIFLHLDPRDEGVRVPPWFKKQPQLVLQVGLNMAVPIHDLSVDDQGVSCTLSFSRSPHYCVIPWKAVYALVGEDGRGMVWPDDVPPEVAAQAQQQARPAPPKERGHLRAVPEQGEAADSDTAAQPARRAAGAGARSRGGASAEEAKVKTEAEAAPKKPRRRKSKAAGTSSDAEPARKPPRGATKAAKKTGKVQPVPDPPAAEQPPASSKPKRELPPYLRIVK